MIPFANFTFFGIMLYAVIPTVLLGITGRAGRRWAFFITPSVSGGVNTGIDSMSPRYLSVPNLAIVGGYATFRMADCNVVFARTSPIEIQHAILRSVSCSRSRRSLPPNFCR